MFAGSAVPVGNHIIRMHGHKWELSKAMYDPEILPRYDFDSTQPCAQEIHLWGARYNNGPTYVVSTDVADYIGQYQALATMYPFRLEDAFAGIILGNIDVFASSMAHTASGAPFIIVIL